MNNTSFRDPSGFVFKKNSEIYRQINKTYKAEYLTLTNSGLYDTLVKKNYLISHIELEPDYDTDNEFYKLIKPEQLTTISYPHEWCFSQLKDAALLTLNIQKLTMKYDMSLKDASTYNIQFKNGKPIFIDTLSFEIYNEKAPWIAYGQFCKHFLAPLALMCYTDVSLNQLFVTNIDGIPLNLAVKLLPTKARLNAGLLLHLFLHNNSNEKHQGDKIVNQAQGSSRLALEGLLDSLISTVKGLKLPKSKTEWGDYYNNTNYTSSAFEQKKTLIKELIAKTSPKKLCDIGANRGDFTRLASKATECISFDIDFNAVEQNYSIVKSNNETNILPLLLDLTNPSPAIGFANKERDNFATRYKCDTILALALIHHLAISNNLPFENIASFFAELTNYLIIEFVPKSDSKVQILLGSRKDIFANYTEEQFELVFSKHFEIIEKHSISDSLRKVYLMRRK